jgi:hypothetical protein
MRLTHSIKSQEDTMVRALLAATALAALLATPTMAEQTSPSSSASDASSSSVAQPAAANTDQARKPVDILSGYTRVDTDLLATKIIGAPVFDSKAKDANKLGDINDLILDKNGQVAAVVLGVGGVLGLGEKQVAVDFAALEFVVADDNTERYVLNSNVDELTRAPDFLGVEDEPSEASDVSASSSSTAQ